MMPTIKKITKRIFRYLRAIDRRIAIVLNYRTVFRPRPVSVEIINHLTLEQITEFDRASFARYSKNPKASILYKVYKGVRNRIFVRLYRTFRRIFK
jgi:hypothetical protein